jgi:hypothetical protein
MLGSGRDAMIARSARVSRDRPQTGWLSRFGGSKGLAPLRVWAEPSLACFAGRPGGHQAREVEIMIARCGVEEVGCGRAPHPTICWAEGRPGGHQAGEVEIMIARCGVEEVGCGRAPHPTRYF